MEINSLKINQEISDIKEQLNGLLDVFYPVGSYYETSDISFYPSSEWGGTWVEDTKGYVTVGGLRDGGDTPREGGLDIDGGVTTGEVEHTLTVDEMPSHDHGLGTLVWANIPGGFMDRYAENHGNYCGSIDKTVTSGNSQPHNNIQPSIGVYRWHRIA